MFGLDGGRTREVLGKESGECRGVDAEMLRGMFF